MWSVLPQHLPAMKFGSKSVALQVAAQFAEAGVDTCISFAPKPPKAPKPEKAAG